MTLSIYLFFSFFYLLEQHAYTCASVVTKAFASHVAEVRSLIKLTGIQTFHCLYIETRPVRTVKHGSKTMHFVNYIFIKGVCGGVVVKALRYKPAGCRLDSRW